MQEYFFKIKKEISGIRLDKFLVENFEESSRSYLQRLIKSGSVFLKNKKITKSAHKLKENDELKINFEKEKPIEVKPDDDIKFDVLAEEKDFIVINKPAGLVVHPGNGNLDKTLVNGLIAKYPKITNVGEDKLRPGIVHRLDKQTSGVMIIARTKKGFDHLKEQFKKRKVKKTYIALTEGHIAKKQGVIEGYMQRSKHNPMKRILNGEKSLQAKFSKTVYNVTKTFEDPQRTLVRALPETGRMHQIRVHLASLGNPIVGDTLYGNKKTAEQKPMYLHAQKISFEDLDGTAKEFETKIPKKFELL